MGRGLCVPKKLEGLLARGSGLTNIGIADAPGVNVLAVGLGLNSIALTLNLVEIDDVGVRTLVGLDTFD